VPLPEPHTPIKNINPRVKKKCLDKVIPRIIKSYTQTDIKRTYFLPYISAILGTMKQLIEYPAKYIDPIIPNEA
jgi:hypothetical protein